MEQKTVPVMIYTEATPNPSTLKFVINRPLMPSDFVELQKAEEGEKSPFAKMLFAMDGVEGVFISNNYVTITKNDKYTWQELMIPAKDVLKAFFETNQAVFEPDFTKPVKQVSNVVVEGDSDLEVRIKGVLDKYVKPAVAMDGGSISFSSFSNGRLVVQLQGSCNGCPSSTVTLKQGIDGLMKRFVPEVLEVVAEGE